MLQNLLQYILQAWLYSQAHHFNIRCRIATIKICAMFISQNTSKIVDVVDEPTVRFVPNRIKNAGVA